MEIYKITETFPEREKFSLVLQMRKAAVSVPANIAEGFKRRSDKEFRQFINIASSSLEETKYYLILSLDLNYINQVTYQRLLDLADEVGKMLYSFHKKLSAEF